MSRRSSRPGGRWTNRPAKNACLKGCREMEVRTAMGSTCDGNCRLGEPAPYPCKACPGGTLQTGTRYGSSSKPKF